MVPPFGGPMAVAQGAQNEEQGAVRRSRPDAPRLGRSLPSEVRVPPSADPRSMTSTLPGDSVRSAALLSDHPAWCVDLGHTLVAMSMYEVWLALAQEHLMPTTKVWREGMPAWE